MSAIPVTQRVVLPTCTSNSGSAGRIEILEAERDRRARGGSVGDLVKDLPRILSGDSARPALVDTRLPPPDAPAVELHWADGREELVADTTLANLPLVGRDDLVAT